MKKYFSRLDKYYSKHDNLMEMIQLMMDRNQNSNYSPDNMDEPK